MQQRGFLDKVTFTQTIDMLGLEGRGPNSHLSQDFLDGIVAQWRAAQPIN